MQRYCADYIVTIKVTDVMITSDETQEEIREKIRTLGNEKLKEWVKGNLDEPDGTSINEEIKITQKGL